MQTVTLGPKHSRFFISFVQPILVLILGIGVLALIAMVGMVPTW